MLGLDTLNREQCTSRRSWSGPVQRPYASATFAAIESDRSYELQSDGPAGEGIPLADAFPHLIGEANGMAVGPQLLESASFHIAASPRRALLAPADCRLPSADSTMETAHQKAGRVQGGICGVLLGAAVWEEALGGYLRQSVVEDQELRLQLDRVGSIEPVLGLGAVAAPGRAATSSSAASRPHRTSSTGSSTTACSRSRRWSGRPACSASGPGWPVRVVPLKRCHGPCVRASLERRS